MAWRRWLCGWVLAAIAVSPLFAQENQKFFPLSEVQPGLKGVGRTVFEGNQIQEFQVEFLGVLKNAIAPKHDVILARLSGGPLAKTGVVAGMSGSPVYVDGKLVGAVALSFPFSTEAFAGITPIEEMLDVVPAARQPTAPNPRPAATLEMRTFPDPESPESVGRLIPDERAEQSDWAKLIPASEGNESLASLRLPLRFGGFSPGILKAFAPALQQLGFEPMEGGMLAGSPLPEQGSAAPSAGELAPGSMISVLLVQGDLNLNVDCTITLRQGDNLYACGHRFLLTGPVEFPFAPAHVLATVPNLANSFKVDEPGAPVGSIRQDRFGAIYGVVGDKAKMIPVSLHVDSTLNRQENYHFEMVEQNFLTPLLANLAISSALTSTERAVGPSTLNVKGTIRLTSGDTVDVEDVLAGDINTANLAGTSIALPLAYLLGSGFPNLGVAGIDLNITARNEKRVATLEQAWCTQSEVRPGDHLEVIAVLRKASGEQLTERIPVDIPVSVRDKELSLVVGDGATINAMENRLGPFGAFNSLRDLHQLVEALNKMRRNNRLYALLMAPQRSFVLHGNEYPSPPPSLLQTFLADPAVASSAIYRGTSVVGDFETKPFPYSIQGQKTLMLKVASVGP
jgi:SpoIVB peptidase S55